MRSSTPCSRLDALRRVARRAGALAVALAGLAAVARADSGSAGAEAAYERGARAMRQGDVAAAVAALAQAVELAPADARALSLYAQALLVSGDAEGSAAALERLRAVDPQAPGLEYFLGLASYRLGNWAVTRDHLLAALETRPDSSLTHLFLGVAYQELGDLEAAGRAFDEAERLDPALQGQIAYRRGLLAVSQQRFDDAKGYFERVRERLPDSLLSRSASSYLVRLERRSPRPYALWATAGGGYDSNLNLATDNDPAVVSDKKAGVAIFDLGGSVRQRAGPLELRAGQSFYANFYGDHSDFDQQISRTWLGASAALLDELEADLGYLFEQVWVQWDDFRRTHAVEPGLTWRHDQLLVRSFYRFEERRFDPFLTPPLDRDGIVQWAGVDVSHALPDLGWGAGWVATGFHYRNENAQGRDFDANGYQPVASLGFPLPGRWLWHTESAYEFRRYLHPSSVDPVPGDRRDRIWELQTSLSRPLFDRVIAELRYRYTDRQSNANVFGYDRHEAQFLATYQY